MALQLCFTRSARILLEKMSYSVFGIFFNNNILQRNQNHSFIALVSKLSGSHTAHQFKPISLCNIVYKIISKIPTNRLKVYLHNIISLFYSAFVPKRNIQDNMILAHELLHSFKSKRGNGGFMFLKLDMEKAFDRMKWSFLLAILDKVGFSSIWIAWIINCISSASFSMNGNLYRHLSLERWLRLGDSLSLFLFILGSEIFPRLLLKEERKGSIKGLRIAKICASLHHLLFANDLLMFTKASTSEASYFKTCLVKYCNWYG
jgi:hypothetical protein